MVLLTLMRCIPNSFLQEQARRIQNILNSNFYVNVSRLTLVVTVNGMWGGGLCVLLLLQDLFVKNIGKFYVYVFLAMLLKGAHQGLLDPNFPWKILPYPEISRKTFNFSDPRFFASSFRRVFCSRLKALFQTMTIEQLRINSSIRLYHEAYQGSLGSSIHEKISL